jgi:hypothetical protein
MLISDEKESVLETVLVYFKAPPLNSRGLEWERKEKVSNPI